MTKFYQKNIKSNLNPKNYLKKHKIKSTQIFKYNPKPVYIGASFNVNSLENYYFILSVSLAQY